MSMTHLDCLELRLSNERARLGLAKTEQQREMRRVIVAQIEREIIGELAFLGQTAPEPVEMSDDEIISALGVDKG